MFLEKLLIRQHLRHSSTFRFWKHCKLDSLDCLIKKVTMSKSIINILFCVLLFVQGCSVAKLSSLPKSSNEIDFNKYSFELVNAKEPFWISKTSNEYYFEKPKLYAEEDIFKAIDKAFTANNYVVVKFYKTEKTIFAERGMRANEWKSIAGVYYQIDEKAEKTKVYIQVKITQDISGGWKENRAKKVGVIIEKEL